MDVEFARYGGLDLVEELAELGGSVASVAFADDPSCRNVEGGEQRCGAVPFVVMAPSSRLTGTHRQHRLTAVQRQDLGLFVYTQNDGMCRRRDVEADDVAHLGDEVRIALRRNHCLMGSCFGFDGADVPLAYQGRPAALPGSQEKFDSFSSGPIGETADS